MNINIIKLSHALIALISVLSSCSSRQTPVTNIALQSAADRTLGVRLLVPENWKIHSNKFFQIIAIGMASNGYPAWIEYRGLESSRLTDQKSRDSYAQGWFEAITKNYPEWKSELPVKTEIKGETVYEVTGTYRVASDTFRKLARLRIQDTRIHAIYYTAYDVNPEMVMNAFREMDEEHNFNYGN